MDPNATLKRILDAKTRDEHWAACQDLADWLDKGGSKPTGPVQYRPGYGTPYVLYDDHEMSYLPLSLVKYDKKGAVVKVWTL